MRVARLVLWSALILELSEARLWTPKLPKRSVKRSQTFVRAVEADLTDSDIPQAQKIAVPIDHFNGDDLRTYENRFWVNDTFYQTGGPVFFIDAGENGVGDGFIEAYLTENSGRAAGISLAREYHGLAVLWEHRFYGGSLPFALNPRTGLAEAGYDAYRYLTVDQALQDAVYFANHFMPDGLNDYWDDLSPAKTPWIWIGGSYPGTRAALARVSNPDTFFASWASSAPVQGTLEFTTYYEQLSADMTSNCSADIRAAVGHYDTLTREGTAEQVDIATALLYIITQGEITDFDSLTVCMSSYADDVQYYAEEAKELWTMANILESVIPRTFQTYGFESSMLPICDRLETFDPRAILTYNEFDSSDISDIVRLVAFPDKAKPMDEGLASRHGAEGAWYAMLSALVADYSGENEASTSPYFYSSDATSWQWQTCSQFGYYQVSNTSSQYNILSGYINITSWQEHECGVFFDYPELSIPADVSGLNKYGGWNMQPSNVMFTNGLKDPWHTISVQSTNVEIGAPNRITTQDIPVCNQPPPNGQVFGLLYPNAYHASDIVDFNLDSAGHLQSGSTFGEGFDLFKSALNTWLPCFNKTEASTKPSPPNNSAQPSDPSQPSDSMSFATSYAAVYPGQLFVLVGLIFAMLLLAIW